MKRYIGIIYDIAFFGFIFIISHTPLNDFDIWFHIKSGEIFAKLGIIHYDVFSYTAAGREWFPYEWLFQIIVYFTQQIAGLEGITYLTAAMSTILVACLYFCLRKLLDVNRLFSIIVCFIFVAQVFEFFTPRPHIFAYTFLLINLNLLLLYFIKNKNYLWLSIPVTLAWANLHGSIFLDIALFGAYTILAFLMSTFDFSFSDFPSKVLRFSAIKTDENKKMLIKSKILGAYTIITIICSVLPPLGFTQYRLLWIFAANNKFISNYIAEWAPLTINPISFYIYTITLIIVFIFTAAILIYKKQLANSLFLLPLIVFPLSAYTASRNVLLGSITMALYLGFALSKIKVSEFTKFLKGSFVVVTILVLLFHAWLLSLKMAPINLYYPVGATNFIKNYHLQGHMFNEYGYGGYLLYNLYPEQKVFFDGRTDVYLCCEMRDTYQMAVKKNEDDTAYKNYLDDFFNKYKISFALIRTEKNTIYRKIGRILTDDPTWKLVFWDDNTQIFVKNDGLNDDIIKHFGVSVATPYDQNPYKNGKDTQALSEYQRMVEVTDSAKSRNAIGYIYLKQKKYDLAKEEFEKAISIYPNDESPYMNLAELAVYYGNVDQAIKLYEAAKNLAPDRGLIYIRLGQLYIQQNDDTAAARQIWEEGIQNTADDKTRKNLEQLLTSL